MSLPVENKRVMMEIEIKFGKGRSDRVQVHFDDDPAALADVSLLCFSTPPHPIPPCLPILIVKCTSVIGLCQTS